jgi:hypothetical protein
MSLPDPITLRRIALLERQVQSLESQLRRLSTTRSITPLNARLWRCSLKEAFGHVDPHYASADLLSISGVDTGLDVSLFDPLDVFAILNGTEGLYCFEQIDINGARHFVPMQSPCPL